ncbi:MAG: NAD-dependent epimerase/dehydratase family protein [Chlamydiales bacterium]|nr:NAD-dependent epimerase/dehydratase family protein [Chlamydiales bacterium]
MSSKKVFLTGSAGFIGFHLAQKLKERGDLVTGFDNFNHYYDPKLKRDRAHLLKKMGIDVIEGDICDATKLNEIFQKQEFTHIVHLAAQAGVRHSLTHPDSYISSNIQGFVNLLEVCKQKSSMPFIYASSSSVYGCNKKTPFSVNDQTDKPANLYGATKKAGELIAYAYHHLYKIPMTGLRFFTVYGPFGRPDMACFSFTKALFENKALPIFNHGKMLRDFTYIDDITEGTLFAIDKAYPFELFNLGNHKPEELMTMIHTLEQLTQKKAILNYLPMQPGDMLSTFADIDHSESKLGYRPKTSLEVGLSNFVQWYRSYYHV